MKKARRKGPARRKSARLTVTFPREQYELLERIAQDKKVSVGWVVRAAAEKYLSDQWPLLSKEE